MKPIIDRRFFFKIAATGVAGCFVSPMQTVETFAQSAVAAPPTILGSARNVIFVLLPGAPSQVDTLDLKVGSWTPRTFNPTTVNGIDWPNGLLPNLGNQLAQGRFSIVRSCQTTALVHPLLQTWTQIARSPISATGTIAPNMGSIVAYEFERQRRPGQNMPGFLSLNTGGVLRGSGYFSSRYSPFDVVPGANGLTNLLNPDGEEAFERRFAKLQLADAPLRAKASPRGSKFDEMADFYSSTEQMMYDPTVANAFRFSTAEQARYGNSAFGNACVTARNVLAADLGARYIQINLTGWDNHQNIYTNILNPARQLDLGLSNLMSDLAKTPGSDGRTLLDETLIVAKGEFGRTVGALTAAAGRDHYFVHSMLIGGGGVRGGVALGATTSNGSFIEDPGWSAARPVMADDVAATIYSAVGIDYTTVLHDDPLGRGFEYIPTTGAFVGQPIVELFQ